MISTVEKVRRLEQYLAMQGSGIDAIVDQSISKLLSRERRRLEDLQTRLKDQLDQFEETYALDTADFYRRYEAGEMGDDLDYVEWAATWEMLENIKRRMAVIEVESVS